MVFHTRLAAGGTTMVVAVAAVASLVTYVLVASGSARQAGATPPAAVAHPSSPSAGAPAAEKSGPVQQPVLGISVPTTDDLDRFIAATGTRPEVVDIFEAWSENRPLQRGIADTVAARGAQLSITWEPWESTGSPISQPDYSLASIIACAHDSYIDMYAASVRRYPHRVTIRLMHEMNGSWYPWASGVNGNQPGEFVLAWQHVRDRFTALGVSNVDWMWAPNAIYTGDAPLATLYPGDAYVDAVGLSNYNWGGKGPNGFTRHWRGFSTLFTDSIAAVQAVTKHPLWIAETASSNSDGSKAAWLTQTLAQLGQQPEIAGLVWFDHLDQARGVDWRIETEADAAEAWRAGFVSRRTTQRIGGRPE
jgi:mannan endo-1,4-beta-mannosidase